MQINLSELQKIPLHEAVKEQLLPCPHCGGEARLCSTGTMNAFVSCVECNAEAGCYAEDGIGVALWNSRVPAVPQWTKETPTEEGWYFLKRDMFDVLIVSVYRKGEELWVKYPADNIRLADHKPALWCKIEMPPLPESK